MSYEVDFLAVGSESSSGDAIAMRYGNFLRDPNDQVVIVIDGGYAENGDELVNHIRRYYHTNRVDVVVSTHPDGDHIGGLSTVLENMEVGLLAMHRPWMHAARIRNMFHDGRITDFSLSERFRASLEQAHDLEQLALRRRIPIVEPFTGVQLTPELTVVGPSLDYYCSLLPEFGQNGVRGIATAGLWGRIAQAGTAVLRALVETWYEEALAEPAEDATSARNNSSTVMLFEHGTEYFLFTADAGVPALRNALPVVAQLGYGAGQIPFVQIPHHGSKRNVGPSMMSVLFGPVRTPGTLSGQTGIISAAGKGEPKHPSNRVINAATRRGAKVNATQGNGLCYRSLDVPGRPGWVPVAPKPFTPEYEEEE